MIIPTYNEGLEDAIISKILKDGTLFSLVEGIVDYRSFVWPPYRTLWDTLFQMNSMGVEISPYTVCTHLGKNGMLSIMSKAGGTLRGEEFIFSLYNSEDEFVNITGIETIASQLQSFSASRLLIDLSDKIKGDVSSLRPVEKIMGDVDISIGEISSMIGKRIKKIETSESVARTTYENILNAAKGENPYVETGIDAWDSAVGGMRRGRVYMIAGSTGSGKTSLAQSILYKKSFEPLPENQAIGGLISIEMGNDENSLRLIQMDSGLDPIAVEKGLLNPNELGKLKESLDKLKKSKIYFDDTPSINISQLKVKIQKMASLGVFYIVIDQLDLISLRDGTKNGYSDTDEKSYAIKNFAREFDVAIILLHQLNKSSDSVMRKSAWNVNKADVKEAGPNAVDGLVIVRHDDEGKNALIWEKARQGKLGKFWCKYDPEKNLYGNLASGELRPNELDFLGGGEDG